MKLNSATLRMETSSVFTKNFNAKSRIVINEGGTRSSKTYSLCQLFIHKLLTEQDIVIDVFRKTLPALKSSALVDFLELLKKYNIYNPDFHNKTDNFYIIGTNRINFISCDDSQKVRGRKRTYAWLNEANELSLEDFTQIALRTTKQIFLDYNPSVEDTHWLITDLQNRPDFSLIRSSYLDNPFLNQETLDEIKLLKRLDPSYWTVYGEGTRATLSFGKIFPKINYSEYDKLPTDIISVIYCDPNLSKKGKGDSTAIVNLGFSVSTGKYYVINALAKSFSSSQDLLDTIALFKTPTTTAIAFDGHVNQESSWTDRVNSWQIINKQPFYHIEYKRYLVDILSKTASLFWKDNKILFPPAFNQNISHKLFLAQLFSFVSKKDNTKDDAADALICAIEFLHEKGISKSYNFNFKQPKIPLIYW